MSDHASPPAAGGRPRLSAASCDGGDGWEDEDPDEDEDDEDEDEDEEGGWGDEPPDGPGWSVAPGPV